MSWCRWGSPCIDTFPFTYKVDEACSPCPGSSVYVFEDCSDGFTCCCCPLKKDGTDFRCATEREMEQHLLEHDAVGHHVRRSLLEWAHGREPELTEASAKFRDAVLRGTTN